MSFLWYRVPGSNQGKQTILDCPLDFEGSAAQDLVHGEFSQEVLGKIRVAHYGRPLDFGGREN